MFNAKKEIMVVVVATLLVGVAVQFGWIKAGGAWIDSQTNTFCNDWANRYGRDAMFSVRFGVYGLIGVVLVSLLCGTFSSLVVSNRMAFFSDALAHCAFAGVALGLILLFVEIISGEDAILPIMIVFGIIMGVSIAYIKENTILANDTVIGVFFAGAMGLGAMLLKPLHRRRGPFNPENFLFGDPLGFDGQDLIYLLGLLVLMSVFLYRMYNRVVFATFNPSLARSRQVPVRYGNYLFIVLLAVVVNIGLKVVGVLLINAMLIVPGATASNLSRNLRQFFWLSALISLVAGVGGFLMSNWWDDVGVGGIIVEIGVVLFFLSILVGPHVRGARASVRSTL